MLRFLPDSWIEGLLRPFILLDPSGYIYYETQAPDLRFAALAVLTLALLLKGRLWSAELRPIAWTLAALWLMFYIWTFVVGNGRYFIAGLMLVGPLLVALVGRLSLTIPMRMTILAGMLALQCLLVYQLFSHGAWALAYWVKGPGLPLGDTPLRKQPAVFISLSALTHSMLVPQFDPRSRWANIAPQQKIVPGSPEFAHLHALLASPMPRYAVLPILEGRLTDGIQPIGNVQEMIRSTLARYGLSRTEQRCEVLRSHLLTKDPAVAGAPARPAVYWFCPLRADLLPEESTKPMPGPWDDVMDAMERRCPRYFPPGRGAQIPMGGDAVVRSYVETDTRLYVDGLGNVLVRYLRALNPTFIASAEQVRLGNFTINCQKLPGRYVYPWQRD
jgi:hypothetical protein